MKPEDMQSLSPSFPFSAWCSSGKEPQDSSKLIYSFPETPPETFQKQEKVVSEKFSVPSLTILPCFPSVGNSHAEAVTAGGHGNRIIDITVWKS